MVKAPKKLAFIRERADDQMRVRRCSGKMSFRNLDGGVAALDDLLRKWDVGPGEEIDVRGVVLCELHDSSLSLILASFYTMSRAR